MWQTFLNDSGWESGGVAFLTGLVSPNYMYAGIDGALHLAEEAKDAATVVPRALLSTLTIGFVTSFAFMIAMLYCTNDLDAAVSTKTGYAIFSPLYRSTLTSVQSPHLRNVDTSNSFRYCSHSLLHASLLCSLFCSNRCPRDRLTSHLVSC